MRHVISALVMNEPGVLANVAGMFAARGFNIDSLVVGRTENPDLSRMTIVVNADDNTVEQVRKQLAKLVPIALFVLIGLLLALSSGYLVLTYFRHAAANSSSVAAAIGS